MQTNNPQSVNAMAIPNMTTSVVPVNMDEQERQKLERKRERNRLAATKCRQRKIQKNKCSRTRSTSFNRAE